MGILGLAVAFLIVWILWETFKNIVVVIIFVVCVALVAGVLQRSGRL